MVAMGMSKKRDKREHLCQYYLHTCHLLAETPKISLFITDKINTQEHKS